MESQRRARAEDLDRLRLARARRFAEPPLPGDAELVDLDPRRVDRVRPRGEPDLRGDRTHAGIALTRGEQLTKRIRMKGTVVVHEGDPLPSCDGEPRRA